MKYLCKLTTDVANPFYRADRLYPFTWFNVPVFPAGERYLLTTWDEPEPGAHVSQWGETAHSSPKLTALLQPHLQQDLSLTGLLISHSIGPQPRGMERAALQILFQLLDAGDVSLEHVYAAAFAAAALDGDAEDALMLRQGMPSEWALHKVLRKAQVREQDEQDDREAQEAEMNRLEV